MLPKDIARNYMNIWQYVDTYDDSELTYLLSSLSDAFSGEEGIVCELQIFIVP